MCLRSFLLIFSLLVTGCSALFPISDEKYQNGLTASGGSPPIALGGSPAEVPSTGGVTSASGGATGSGGAPPPKLLHHYPFDVLQQSPEDLVMPGVVGNILTNGNVNIASDSTRGNFYFLLDNAAIEFAGQAIPTGATSLSIWVKPDKPEIRTILDQQSMSSDKGFRFLLGSIGGTNIPELRVGGATGFDVVSAKSPAPVGVWTHLAFTITGSPGTVSVALYVNGQLEHDQTATMPHPFSNQATPLHIGIPAQNKDMAPFMGGIDDFRIYEGVLTKEQVRDIYFSTL